MGGGGGAAAEGREEKGDERRRGRVSGEEAGERWVWGTQGGWRYIGMYFSRKATVRGKEDTGKNEGGWRDKREIKRKGCERKKSERKEG